MSPDRGDLYGVLAVAPTATPAEITSAYRAMLRRHHPDTRPGQDSRVAAVDDDLQAVLHAYAVLRDPVRRAAYDRQTRPAPARPRRVAGPHPPASKREPRPPIQAGPVRWHF